MKFEGRTVIVTGGGRNVGQAISRRFAEEGANVAVVDLDAGRGEAVAEELNAKRAGSARFVTCDVSSSEDVQRMVAEVVEAFGGVDVLVNNVAITDRGRSVLDLDEEMWRKVHAVTLDSVFFCSKYAGRQMVAQGRGGAIVNIGSTSGYRGRANATAYSSAKGAVLNLSRSLASQLGEYGIRVNTVTPNKVGSPVGEDVEPTDHKRRNLLGRGAVPEDIANAVVFLASDEAGFVTAAAPRRRRLPLRSPPELNPAQRSLPPWALPRSCCESDWAVADEVISHTTWAMPSHSQAGRLRGLSLSATVSAVANIECGMEAWMHNECVDAP